MHEAFDQIIEIQAQSNLVPGNIRKQEIQQCVQQWER